MGPRPWPLAFRIGVRTRVRGHRPTGAAELLRRSRTDFRDRVVNALSD